MSGMLGVIHVPKCGGSAVRSALGEVEGCYVGPVYFDDPIFGDDTAIIDTIPEPIRATVVAPGALSDVVRGQRIVVGHYAASSLLAAGCTELALQVREPRSRVLSLYRYWQTMPAAERIGWGRWGTEVVARADRPFAEYVATTSLWAATENSIARQVLGLRMRPVRRSSAARAQVERAGYARMVQRLRVLEWSEDSTRFVLRVCEAVGAHSPAVQRVNVTTVEQEQQLLGGAALRTLERITAADRAFVEALMRDGLLPRRSVRQLDDEFAATAARLQFRL